MANVKDIEIHATIPFDGGSSFIREFLGRCSIPGYGLKVTFLNKQFYKENKYGGVTCMFAATISGKEAINLKYYALLIAELEKHGSVKNQKCVDIEVFA